MKTKDGERIIRTGCPAHNCGGRCLLLVHVKNGVITQVRTDDRPHDSLMEPQLRACVRGRSYLRRQYHPDRLMYPLKRTGPRGEGSFSRISWDEALDTIASEFTRIKGKYGNSALFVPYGTGGYSQLTGAQTARRLMNLFGGCLWIYNRYSWGATNIATPYFYGTLKTGNHRQDWINSKYIIMWGWNPAEMRDGTNSDYFINKARQNGAKVVCIDPRMTMSAVSLTDEWIPIKPGTDAAMMSAMAHVLITENLYDRNFIEKYCVGFDESQMPPGAEYAESYEDYILGYKDGVPKSPIWTQKITGVPKEIVTKIAREYASHKPGILYQGYGMQRRAYGEQVVLAGCALASLTGNVGISGGWASGLGRQPKSEPYWNLFPIGDNPVKAQIPVFLWTEAILRGTELGAEDGVLGVKKLDNNIKLLYAVASNIVNQHANINRTASILKDEGLVEFILVQDNFLTPTARFADVVLPACTQFETWGIADGWKYGQEVLFMPKLIEPPQETKGDYRICLEIAESLGFGDIYSEGRNEKDWLDWVLGHYRKNWFPNIPNLTEFIKSNIGVYSIPIEHPEIAFSEFRKDPVSNPLNTLSGKIEFFSKRLFDLNNPTRIPPVPKYIQEWESPFGPEAELYPLQAIGHHFMGRVHSTHSNNDWLIESFPPRLFMNPIDAELRNIMDGDKVMVFNDRGATIISSRVTNRILPGVVDLPQGGWWSPDNEGVDLQGAINVLTSEKWSPLAKASTQHTIMVQVKKVD